MADSTLTAIRTKVRRLTLSPSESQLTTAELDEYVNTFYQQDFPEHLRLFTNLVPFKFYTQPNVATYASNSDALTAINTLSDYKNLVISTHDPFYIDGLPAFFSQSPSEFYALYPQVKSVGDTQLRGDGATTSFSGTLSSLLGNQPVENRGSAILEGSVSFTSKTTTNGGLNLVDDSNGVLDGDGSGTINYLTGAFTLNFSTAPADGEPINFHVYTYTASVPRAVMYYGNVFTVRPIPDDVYEVSFQVYQTFTDFASSSSTPELNQWWQYISYGAAKKIFEDRMDMDNVALILPEFKQQERLVLRRTIVQNTNERVATIYTEGAGLGGGWFWNGNNGN